MNADAYWKLFTQTGNILFYLIYRMLAGKEDGEKTA